MKSKNSPRQRRDMTLYDMIMRRMVEIRKAHNHTQEYVAVNTGLDIPHYEAGHVFPTLTSIAIFCRLYSMTLDEFFAPMGYPSKER